MRTPLLVLAAGGLLLLLAGCGRLVEVSAYVDGRQPLGLVPGASFCLLSQNQTANPLMDRRVADKIGLMLTNAGHRLDGPGQAEFLLVFSYRRHTSTGTDYVSVYEPGRRVQVTQVDRDGKRSTTYVDEPGYTTYQPRLVTVNQDSLRLVAYANQRQGQAAPELAVWSVDALTRQSDGGLGGEGLAASLDYLIVGGMTMLGQATSEPVSFLVKDDDPRLKLIQGRP
ncbi:MAG: hypothetical protein V1806_11260 [Pseudomonadota bacterium]